MTAISQTALWPAYNYTLCSNDCGAFLYRNPFGGPYRFTCPGSTTHPKYDETTQRTYFKRHLTEAVVLDGGIFLGRDSNIPTPPADHYLGAVFTNNPPDESCFSYHYVGYDPDGNGWFDKPFSYGDPKWIGLKGIDTLAPLQDEMNKIGFSHLNGWYGFPIKGLPFGPYARIAEISGISVRALTKQGFSRAEIDEKVMYHSVFSDLKESLRASPVKLDSILDVYNEFHRKDAETQSVPASVFNHRVRKAYAKTFSGKLTSVLGNPKYR